MRKFLFIIVLFFSFSQANALVDMKNANFSDYWVDLMYPENNYLMKISRNYSSRSLFSGIFGFGWCSQIETKIDITLEGNLILSECGSGAVHFYPANYNTQLINDSVEKILIAIKKNEPNKSKKQIDDLREQLRTDHKLRTQYAGNVGFKISPVKNTVFLMNGKEVDKITFDGSFYVRQIPDGSIQKFDSLGRLNYLYDKQKNFLKFTYSSGLATQITDNLGRKLTLSYYPERKIKQITATNMLVKYKFNGENLVQVENAWKNNYTYSYDANHNLTKIDFPDGSYKAMSYIESKDWIRDFRDRDACVETYEFTMSQENPKDHYWSTAIKNCKGKTIYRNRYEFWYQTRPDKEKYLSRVVSEKNSQTLDISYHQDFGKPISIRRNADVTAFQYLNNGFLKQKTVSLFIPQNDETHKYTLYFNYDKDWRIDSTTTEFFNKSGKVLRKKITSFKYDAANRLTLAKSSDGQFVELKYNNQGLISAISDQTKKEVLIDYDPKTQRPTTIARPSVGSLQLSYAANGDLKKIHNKGGSSTSTQIYSAFNNFIDMVGPVSTELSLNL
jgi:YD repeat-containing protein